MDICGRENKKKTLCMRKVPHGKTCWQHSQNYKLSDTKIDYQCYIIDKESNFKAENAFYNEDLGYNADKQTKTMKIYFHFYIKSSLDFIENFINLREKYDNEGNHGNPPFPQTLPVRNTMAVIQDMVNYISTIGGMSDFQESVYKSFVAEKKSIPASDVSKINKIKNFNRLLGVYGFDLDDDINDKKINKPTIVFSGKKESDPGHWVSVLPKEKEHYDSTHHGGFQYSGSHQFCQTYAMIHLCGLSDKSSCKNKNTFEDGVEAVINFLSKIADLHHEGYQIKGINKIWLDIVKLLKSFLDSKNPIVKNSVLDNFSWLEIYGGPIGVGGF